jgi:hypothetical protein
MSALEFTSVRKPARNWNLAICAGVLLFSALALPANLSAQPALREKTALKLIPDDAAFFSSSLRLKQQFDAFARSKAFARISELSFVTSMFVPTGVLSRSDQPAARVWYVNFAGLMDVVQSWAGYAFTVAAAFVPDAVPGDTSTTVDTVFEILKCWRGSAGISYFDGKALVEFSEIVFEDLK